MNSGDPSHSAFPGNYEYAFAVVVFQSARLDCRSAAPEKHLLPLKTQITYKKCSVRTRRGPEMGSRGASELRAGMGGGQMKQEATPSNHHQSLCSEGRTLLIRFADPSVF